jgi:hypothetical protein
MGNLTEPAATTTNEHAATPYDSGYSHGCSDAKISNLSERYINQPGKGTTSNYTCTDGYIDGWKHWCMTNTKDCASATTSEIFPGYIVNDKVLEELFINHWACYPNGAAPSSGLRCPPGYSTTANPNFHH